MTEKARFVIDKAWDIASKITTVAIIGVSVALIDGLIDIRVLQERVNNLPPSGLVSNVVDMRLSVAELLKVTRENRERLTRIETKMEYFDKLNK